MGRTRSCSPLAGSKDFARPVTIEAGRTTLLDARLVPAGSTGEGSGTVSTLAPGSGAGTGTLVFQSKPAGATVYIDGDPSGTTPLTVRNVNPGTHKILLTLQGYPDIIRTVTVPAGGQETVSPGTSPAERACRGSGIYFRQLRSGWHSDLHENVSGKPDRHRAACRPAARMGRQEAFRPGYGRDYIRRDPEKLFF